MDQATVRVFAIGVVGVDNIVLPDGRPMAISRATAGHGTGFLVAPGLVMTAAHVIAGARHVVIRLPGDGGFFSARVAFANEAHDTAVLAIEAPTKMLPDSLTLLDERPAVRQTVFAVGYPIDATRRQPQSARGIIAGYLEEGTLQVDMALNPGNSGGPLVDEANRVVGMVVARGNVKSGVQGIGYAVPIAQLAVARAEAERRLATGIVPALKAAQRGSALVVDEMVQHGVLYSLANATELQDDLDVVAFDRVLSKLLSQVGDPDLLLVVAGAMWNAAIALEYGIRTQIPKQLTVAQASVLAERLRASARAACEKAVGLEPDVVKRSPFVSLVMDASARAYKRREVARSSSNVLTLLFATPHYRWNPASGASAWGFGASMTLLVPNARSSSAFVLGAGLGRIAGSVDNKTYSHMIAVADLGGALLDASQSLVVYGAAGVAYYRIMNDQLEETTPAGTLRVGVALRTDGGLVLGAALRAFTGPTFWFEPLNLGFTF